MTERRTAKRLSIVGSKLNSTERRLAELKADYDIVRKKMSALDAMIQLWWQDLDAVIPIDQSRGKIRLSLQAADYIRKLQAENEQLKGKT